MRDKNNYFVRDGHSFVHGKIVTIRTAASTDHSEEPSRPQAPQLFMSDQD